MFYSSKDIDKLVSEVARQKTRPVIDATVEEIAYEIGVITGHKPPSKSVIWASLKRIGAVSTGKNFVYRHKVSHE